MYQKDKSSESSVRLRQASNCWESILEATKLAYANKTKESITFQKLGSRDFWQIANSVLNNGKSAVTPLFHNIEVFSSPSDKAKLFAENFSKNSNLGDSGISLYIFPSRTNLKLHNIYVTPKMVKKVIINFAFKSMVPVFKNVGEGSTAKNYCPVSLLSVISKVFEKLINNRIADHLKKCGLFFSFPVWF